jgi:hypothetical protein
MGCVSLQHTEGESRSTHRQCRTQLLAQIVAFQETAATPDEHIYGCLPVCMCTETDAMLLVRLYQVLCNVAHRTGFQAAMTAAAAKWHRQQHASTMQA